MFKAVSLVGYKKSGKTTLLVALAKELTARGHTVGAVKFSHHGFDRQETDTAKFSQECVSVAGIGPKDCFVHWNRARQLQDIFPLLRADIILVEGGKSLTWLPRIVLLGSSEDESLLSNGLALASWGPSQLPDITPAASIADLAAIVAERAFTLPGLDCGACGRDSCHELAQSIVAGEARPAACVAMRPGIAIRVGGQQLSLNPFIDRLFIAALRGMLGELKGYVPGQRVDISLD